MAANDFIPEQQMIDPGFFVISESDSLNIVTHAAHCDNKVALELIYQKPLRLTSNECNRLDCFIIKVLENMIFALPILEESNLSHARGDSYTQSCLSSFKVTRKRILLKP